ncbi:MAG TPA: hypothetical protein VN691_01485 [Steroidobacteraceae bacterium]|nr:hypothetical protein [Steroidobacteraceae bacterium]
MGSDRAPSTGRYRGVRGLCLDPHDLAISKYVAFREKDLIFTRELARRGLISRDQLLALLAQTNIGDDLRAKIRARIAADFGQPDRG